MKSIFLFFAFFSLFSTICCQENIKVLSYNIRWDNPDDGEDAWDHRKEALSSFIAEENLDFIGLQEVLESQLGFIKRFLGTHDHIGVGRDDGLTKGEYSPILYDSASWKLLEYKNKWLSEYPDSVSRGWDAACNRVLSVGLFQNKKTDNQVLVMNTHFDHVGKTAREESAKLIVKWVKDYSKVSNIILMGDFNFNPSDPLYSIIINEMRDARKVATKVYEDNVGSFNGFNLEGPFDRRIDFIFVKSGMNVETYHNIEIRINGRQLSDHFPIITELSF